MSTPHRPHPITGPWPLVLREHDADAAEAEGVVRAARVVPDPSSLIYADPEDAELFDGCARCFQLAQRPAQLDPERFASLWRRMVDVELNDGAYRTRTESEGCRALYEIALTIERHSPGVDPWRWPWTTRMPVPMEGMYELDQREPWWIGGA